MRERDPLKVFVNLLGLLKPGSDSVRLTIGMEGLVVLALKFDPHGLGAITTLDTQKAWADSVDCEIYDPCGGYGLQLLAQVRGLRISLM